MKKKRIVIKVGSHVLTQDTEVAKHRMFALVELVANLKVHHYEVILVSSGAVAAGYTLLALDQNDIANRQALAAIGQPLLLSMYQKKFATFDILCSQVLLYAEVFESKEHIVHAKNAIDRLLQHGIVPIVNENDTVSIQELVFGDNDRLSAHVAHHFDAKLLVILSDIDALYDKDPNRYKDATRRAVVSDIAQDELSAEHTPNNVFATGGIVTKLQAASYLLEHKKEMFLASGFDLSDVKSLLIDGVHAGGTLFKA